MVTTAMAVPFTAGASTPALVNGERSSRRWLFSDPLGPFLMRPAAAPVTRNPGTTPPPTVPVAAHATSIGQADCAANPRPLNVRFSTDV